MQHHKMQTTDQNWKELEGDITTCKEVQIWATTVVEQSFMDWWDQD